MNTKKWLKKSLVAFLALAVTACGDGGLKKAATAPDADVTAPVVTFTARNVTQNGEAAESITVAKSDEIELAWEVAGATSVVIESSDGSMKLSDLAPTGLQSIGSVAADATLTLTAMSEQGDMTQKSVSIMVVVSEPATIVSFGKEATISAGDEAELCWEVTPDDAFVRLNNDKGQEYVYGEWTTPVVHADAENVTDESGDVSAEDVVTPVDANTELLGNSKGMKVSGKAAVEGETAEGVEIVAEEEVVAEETGVSLGLPVKSCVTVSPATTTVYTLTATGADGVAQSQSVAITVSEALEVTLTADRTAVASGESVRLSWTVNRSDATLTLTSSLGETIDVTGKSNTTIVVNETVTYTLVAELNGVKSEAKTVTITATASELKMTLNADSTDVFAGESVTLYACVKTDGTLPKELQPVIKGQLAGDLTPAVTDSGAEEGEICRQTTVTLDRSDLFTAEAVLNGQVKGFAALAITVRTWDQPQSGNTVSVGVNGADGSNAFIGMSGELAGGNVKIAKRAKDNAWGSIDVPYESLFDKMIEMPFAHLGGFGAMKVNAVSVDSASGNVYVGLPGAILISKDSGSSWDILNVFRTNGTANKSHVSCFGFDQAGRNGSGELDINGLHQVCDIEVADGRVLVAMDNGLGYYDDVDARLKNTKDSKYMMKGVPTKGNQPNQFWGKAVHALAYDSTNKKLYVGTDEGVFVSTDRGETFTALESLGKAVYDIAVNDQYVYVATPSGVSAYINSAWRELTGVTGTVYSVAVDPDRSMTVYAGSSDGLFVSRTMGAIWSNVTKGLSEEGLQINDIAVAKVGNEMMVYAATSKGFYTSKAPIVPTFSKEKDETPVVTPTEPTEPTVTPEEPAPVPETPVVGDPVVPTVGETATTANGSIL